MGKLTDALHISEHAADNIMKVVLAYLLVGSYGLPLWQWRHGKKGLRWRFARTANAENAS